MFYSQFILAKKGPLGTIWIAAHLERKLRKNQVADTDIGVSVDSIICPEVPIALRLSSHLLLGVVRIYSKKVNYLFNDCSEALLKIKQAFRSSAVDLPPEESTAPYHSITLPETFHLDDFELPDSAGDFVDHHVSTKEQITLQDSMEGAGFLTMQFGLDERFGDGSASHIGIDLDEVFLDKQASPQVNFFNFSQDERVVHQGQCSSSFPGNAMDIDDNQIGFSNEIKVEAPEQFSELDDNDGNELDLTNSVDLNRNDVTSNSHGFDIRTPDLNLLSFQVDHSEVPPGATGLVDVETTVGEFRLPNLAECSHAPSTPGLLGETFSANMPESPASSPQHKHSSSMEVGITTENSSLQPECPDSATNTMGVVSEPHLFESGSMEFSPTLIICEREENIAILGEKLNEQNDVDALQAEYVNNELKDQQIDVGANKDEKSVLTAVAQLEINEVPAETGTLVENIPEVSIAGLGEKLNEQNDVDALQAEYVNNELKDQQIDVGANKDGKSVLTAVAQLEINKVPAEIGTLVENIPEVSIAGPGVIFQSTAEENGLHVEVSDGLLDKGSDTLKVINGYLLHDESGLTRAELAQDVMDIKGLSGSILQNENQPDQLNCSASCELAEPEKMLIPPPADVNLANESSHVTTEKTVTESDGSVNKITSLSGKKRHLTESALLLQGDNISAKSSSRQRIRSTGYVPNDDDLLASILVGKGTPLLRIAPTPPTIIPSSKRPRATKRKVVLDDASVLHADVIRQQLINTEDIRRIRKKAPCTRPYIWLIERGSLGDEIFYEPILTGVSMDLHCLHAGIYDSKTGPQSSCLDSLKKFDVSRVSELVKEVNNKEKAELSSIVPEKTDECVAQEHLESVTELPQVEQSSHDLQATLTTDTVKEKIAEAYVEPQDQITPNDLIASEAQQSLARQVQNGDAQVEQSNNDLRSTLLTTDTIADKIAEVFVAPQEQITRNDLIADEAQQSVSGQVQIGDLQVEKYDAAFNFGEGEPQSTLIDMECQGTVLASVTGHEGLDKREGMHDTKVGAESLTQKDFRDEENHLPSDIFSERPEMAASSLTYPGSENGKFPSTIGENTDFQEFDLERSVDIEGMPFDLTGAKECSDFCSAIDGNDTEFLNVDDEVDYDEEVDNDTSDPQDARSLENSGWSSRTRGVARYLQTIFDEESGLGRKDVSVDRLIAGKTRKEASRMFFETLVLKTKDYIHVEQDSPFDSITVKPKTRLLKSEF